MREYNYIFICLLNNFKLLESKYYQYLGLIILLGFGNINYVFAWKYNEHMYIGYHAYKQACKETAIVQNNKLPSLCGKYIEKEALCYGRFTALSGDHFENADDLLKSADNNSYYINSFDPKDKSKIDSNVFLMDCTDLNRLDDINANDISILKIKDQPIDSIVFKNHMRMGEYSNLEGDISCAFEYFKDLFNNSDYELCVKYFNLAKKNGTHFLPHSYNNWNLISEKARSYARKSNNNSNILIKSLVTNAFADHFLQDSFASGHMGIERNKYPQSVALDFHDERGEKGVIVSYGDQLQLNFGDGNFHRGILAESDNYKDKQECIKYTNCIKNSAIHFLQKEKTKTQDNKRLYLSDLALVYYQNNDNKYSECNDKSPIFICLEDNEFCRKIGLDFSKQVIKSNSDSILGLFQSYDTLNSNTPQPALPVAYYGSWFSYESISPDNGVCKNKYYELVKFYEKSITTNINQSDKSKYIFEPYIHNAFGIKYDYIGRADIHELSLFINVGDWNYKTDSGKKYWHNLSTLEWRMLACEANSGRSISRGNECHLNIPGPVVGWELGRWPEEYTDYTLELILGLELKTYGPDIITQVAALKTTIATPLYSPVIEIGIKRNKKEISTSDEKWNSYISLSVMLWEFN